MTNEQVKRQVIRQALQRQHTEMLERYADEENKAQQLAIKNHILSNEAAYIEGETVASESFNFLTAEELRTRYKEKYSDMDYTLAENLQLLCAGQDPLAEYHDWVSQEEKIETAARVDGTTDQEWVDCKSFISFMDERETELKRVISLYSNAASNPHCYEYFAAQAKMKDLRFKLKELRRLREMMQNVEKVPVKEKNTRENNWLWEEENESSLRKRIQERVEEKLRRKMEHQEDDKIASLQKKKQIWHIFHRLSGRSGDKISKPHVSVTYRPRGFTQEEFWLLNRENRLRA